MIKKLLLTAFAAVLVVPMLNVPEKAYGMELTYSDLTETQPFYRVTKGFEDHSMAELDNNPDTKIEFTKGLGLTNVDYIFPKNAKIKEIRFKTDTPQYQRVLLMRGSTIHWQSDFYKFEDGVITLPSEIQADTIRIQFNGGGNTEHSLSDVSVIGYAMATNSWGLPRNLPELTQPEQIAELIRNANAVPVVEEVPVIEEEETPATEEEQIEDVPAPIEETNPETTEEIPTADEPVIEEEIIEEDEATNEEPVVEETPEEETASEPAIEEPAKEEEVITEEEVVEETFPTEEEVVTPEVVEPVIEEETTEPVIEEPTKEEESVIVEPETEEVLSPEVPVIDDPIEEVLNQLETPKPYLIQGKEQALNSSVFSVSKTYAVYKASSASFKLLNYKQYDENYLFEKLAYSMIRVDGVLLNVEAFIELLHSTKK